MAVKIHIFDANNVSLESLLDSNYFSNIEKKQFDKYKHLGTKKEKIVSEIFKKKYIGDYQVNEFGKPISKDKYFNISHSHEVVVFVMDDVPVGVDIEKITEAQKEMIEYISNEEEKNYIHDEESFYEIWTNKEALVKAYGSGIKSKINEIPALPINGKRIYNNVVYYNKTIKYNGYIITVSREKDEDFELEIVQETI